MVRRTPSLPFYCCHLPHSRLGETQYVCIHLHSSGLCEPANFSFRTQAKLQNSGLSYLENSQLNLNSTIIPSVCPSLGFCANLSESIASLICNPIKQASFAAFDKGSAGCVGAAKKHRFVRRFAIYIPLCIVGTSAVIKVNTG